jgi:hypothetical protein
MTLQPHREIYFMPDFKKTKRYIGRVTEPQSDKLRKLLKQKGQNFSEWLRDRIEKARL